MKKSLYWILIIIFIGSAIAYFSPRGQVCVGAFERGSYIVGCGNPGPGGCMGIEPPGLDDKIQAFVECVGNGGEEYIAQ